VLLNKEADRTLSRTPSSQTYIIMPDRVTCIMDFLSVQGLSLYAFVFNHNKSQSLFHTMTGPHPTYGY